MTKIVTLIVMGFWLNDTQHMALSILILYIMTHSIMTLKNN
jgi:hypothetical protein